MKLSHVETLSWLCGEQGLDFFGGEPLKADDMLQALEWEAEHTEDRIVFVSDIWLDRLDTLARLDAILSGLPPTYAANALAIRAPVNSDGN